MFKNNFNINLTPGRRSFLKAGMLFGLPLVVPTFLTSLVARREKSITTFTRVYSNSRMSRDQFNNLKHLWIDSRRFAETILSFQQKGLILSYDQVQDANSTFVQFVFVSKKAKYDFDQYLVKHKIFHEQRLLEIGLIHETGIS